MEKRNSLDTVFYRSKYPDLEKLSDDELAEHWVRLGQAEGRLPNFAAWLQTWERAGELPDDFDGNEYLAIHADLSRLGWHEWKAALHYVEHGAKEGRATRLADLLEKKNLSLAELPPDFDWEDYLAAHPERRALGVVTRELAILDYLDSARRAQMLQAFDPVFYRSKYRDLEKLSDDELVRHWEMRGQAEGRAPNFAVWLQTWGRASELPTDFDGEEYLAIHADLSRLGWHPWDAAVHYVEHGAKEGRATRIADLLPIRLSLARLRELNPGVELENERRTLLNLLNQDSILILKVDEDPQQNIAFYKQIAQKFEATGNDPKAAALYTATLQWGQDPVVLGHLGDIARRAKRHQLARRWYRQAIDAGSQSPYVWDNLIASSMETGDTESVPELLLQASRLFPASSHIERIAATRTKALWKDAQYDLDYLIACDDRNGLITTVQALVEQQAGLVEAALLRGDGRQPRPTLNTRRVLIVGDHHVPQCLRYRVQQKQEQLQAAGYEVMSLPWTDTEEACEALAWHDLVIFYRVPALPDVVRMMVAARLMGKVTFYEIDDLLFDAQYPPPIETYGGYVKHQEYAGLTRGMALFRAAAGLCDYGIASTRPLAERLATLVRSGHCYLHRNGLDSQNIIPAQMPATDKDRVSLFYGSGTKAHNSDFIEEALPAIQRILEERHDARLIVVGYLELPSEFRTRFSHRVVQLPVTKSIRAYWTYLAGSDINLAVLKRDDMTDCKSELKWFEAACFGIPSVVSETENYLDVIREGIDGCIARGPDGWYAELRRLLDSEADRHAIGKAARERVLEEYGIPALAGNIDRILRDAVARHGQTKEGSPQ